ncbi:UNVERIFIED_CONTAM: hypothetical protein GTU68_044769 [Idotea baltica]|nr:hypothetical protein [Idotea baltica]
MYKHTFKYWHLISKNSREVIGWCGFHKWKLKHDWAEVGYVLSKEGFRKQGLMTEALHRIVEHGFKEMNLNRISAYVGPDNEPSLKLVKGLGFQQEGHLREDYRTPDGLADSLAFGLLKRDFFN